MARLESAFERKARDALIESAADGLFDDPDNLAFRFAEMVNDNFAAYASANGYDIDHIWEEFDVTEAEVTATGAHVRIEWPGLTALFEYGVPPHTIRGNPMLHFFWESEGRWVMTEEVNWGSKTGGIPEARAIRDALEQLPNEVQS